jgi:uncharacterized protein (DUF342 family)
VSGKGTAAVAEQSGQRDPRPEQAAGTEPPPRLSVKPSAIPPELLPYAPQLIPEAVAPRVFLRTVERTKSEKTVRRRPRLPFLPARTAKETVWERREELQPLEGAVEETGRGYVEAGQVIATLLPPEPPPAGPSAPGPAPAAQAPAARPPRPAPLQRRGLYLSPGLREAGMEIRAEASGFFRYGSNWIELFPFRLHRHRVYASADGLSCLLDFTPGSEAASPPTADRLLEEGRGLGFAAEALLSEEAVAMLLSEALTSGSTLQGKSLSAPVDAQMRVEVSEDRLSARLFLRKGRGEGKPLRLEEISKAIRASRLKGLDVERVRRELLEFHQGPQSVLEGYELVAGRPPQAGEDGRIEWRISFLEEQRAAAIRQASVERSEAAAALESLSAFPLAGVEQIAEVEARSTVATVHPATTGQAGVDVFGAVLPGGRGQDPRFKLFENLRRIGHEIVSQAAGILERGSGEDGGLLLRVRPHRDAEVQLRVSEDRMQALLSLVPGEGTGRPLSAEAVAEALAAAGVSKGLLPQAVENALARALSGKRVEGEVVAQGQEPSDGADAELEILVRQASGQSVTLKQDGQADYRRQDRITMVSAGTLLARLPAATAGSEGWTVTGESLPPRPGSARYVHVGKHVESRPEADGAMAYHARVDGELSWQGGSLDVLQVHTVSGDVGLGTGNVRFPGTVRVSGSVRSGFSVYCDESIFVGETVQGAVLSAGDSITVEKGIVGEGRAVLRARKAIRARFAEQSTLLALEEVRLSNACLRCTVKCNGSITLESERGSVIGGQIYCRQGLNAMNVGSERGVTTDVFFGQDVLVQDQLEREQRQTERLQSRNLEIDRELRNLERTYSSDLASIQRLREEKRRNLQLLQLHSKRIFILRERFEQHFPSEIVVRGVIYPGTVLRSHGRERSIERALREVVFYFDTRSGRIEQKALDRSRAGGA